MPRPLNQDELELWASLGPPRTAHVKKDTIKYFPRPNGGDWDKFPLMRKMPWVGQLTTFTCAVACVRAILTALGHDVSEESLRAIANTTKAGTTAEGIRKALSAYNVPFSTVSSLSNAKVRKAVRQGWPVILEMSEWGGTHTVLVTAYEKGYGFLVMDPAIDGKRYYHVEEDPFTAFRWNPIRNKTFGGIVVQLAVDQPIAHEAPKTAPEHVIEP